MSHTDESTASLRDRTSPAARDALGMIRRMAITLTDGAFWQVVGHLLFDGVTREPKQVEPYTGVGFYSRPAPGSNAEAIVVHVGGAQNPAIVATRDEDLRKKVFPSSAPMGQDEAAAFNTQAVMHVKAGKVLTYLVGHIADAVGLAKASELNNLRAFVMQQFSGTPGHTHAVSGAATTTTVPVITPVVAPVTSYPGTTVLHGE